MGKTVFGFMSRPVIRLLMALMLFVYGLAHLPASAALGFSPYQRTAEIQYGQGVWYAPLTFSVYTKPDTGSEKLADITWGNSDQVLTDTLHQVNIPARQGMIAFYPAYRLGLFSVVGDTEDGKWVEIIWDQKGKKTGWVELTGRYTPGYLPELGSYQTWVEFMTTHGKPSGIHWFNGVPESIKQLHSQPDDFAKTIPAFYLQKLKVLHLKGNWMLMQGLDLERNTPIGWVRWREEDGQLLLFPNLDVPENPWRQQQATVKSATPPTNAPAVTPAKQLNITKPSP